MNFSLEVLYAIGALFLLGGIVWGYVQYKHRNRANDRLTDEATSRLYDNPNAYREQQDELKERARPS